MLRCRSVVVVLLRLALLAALGLTAWRAEAQMGLPPHAPGTICLTPTFWCWAIQPGPPGMPCVCPVPGGYVAGILG